MLSGIYMILLMDGSMKSDLFNRGTLALSKFTEKFHKPSGYLQLKKDVTFTFEPVSERKIK